MIFHHEKQSIITSGNGKKVDFGKKYMKNYDNEQESRLVESRNQAPEFKNVEKQKECSYLSKTVCQGLNEYGQTEDTQAL